MATKEQMAQVEDWFMKVFWPRYPAKYCRGGKGSRAMALVEMQKINPDEEEQKRIMGNLDAQIRARKANPNQKWWVIGTTYVHNKLWNDEVESMMELKEKEKLKGCQWDDCSEEVHGPKFIYCTDHQYESTDPFKKHRKQAIHDIGLLPCKGEDLKSWGKRCREYMQNKDPRQLASEICGTD